LGARTFQDAKGIEAGKKYNKENGAQKQGSREAEK